MQKIVKFIVQSNKKAYSDYENMKVFQFLAKKIYYHGRQPGKRPYSGHYVFITTSLPYASKYSQGDVYKYSIPFGPDKLFSIKNKKHLDLIKKYVDNYAIQRVIDDSGVNQEIDWATLSYLSNDDFDEAEDLLQHLGFYGVKLKERQNVDSIYIFNEKKLNFEGMIKPIFKP